jgi:hypothetical protein
MSLVKFDLPGCDSLISSSLHEPPRSKFAGYVEVVSEGFKPGSLGWPYSAIFVTEVEIITALSQSEQQHPTRQIRA